MTVVTASFNPAGATNGATIATTDAGDLTAWNSILGTPKYDNTHTLFGKSLAYKCNPALTFQTVEWTTNYGSTTESYGRLYIYFSALPSPSNGKQGIVQGDTANGPIIGVTNSGNIYLAKATGTTSGTSVATSTTAISLNQWYRLEWHWINGGTSSVSIYTSPDSSTAAETISGAAATAAWTKCQFGGFADTAGTTNGTYWFASVVEHGVTNPIGPYPVNSVAPTVSGSAPSGSTLTAGAGTYNGTFTLTYQWQKAGVDIAGATSSTYVTQAGDVGSAIGVREIATVQQVTNESISTASSNTITVTGGAAPNDAARNSGSAAPFITVIGATV